MPPVVQTPSLRSPAGASDEGGGALAAVRGRRTDWAAIDASHGVESAYALEQADRYTEASRIKVRLPSSFVVISCRCNDDDDDDDVAMIDEIEGQRAPPRADSLSSRQGIT